MRRLLRSVIDVNGEITQENLTLNFQRLLNARIEWGRPDDTKLYNFALGTLTRVTQEGGGHSPVWSPDGTRLAFTAEGPATDG